MWTFKTLQGRIAIKSEFSHTILQGNSLNNSSFCEDVTLSSEIINCLSTGNTCKVFVVTLYKVIEVSFDPFIMFFSFLFSCFTNISFFICYHISSINSYIIHSSIHISFPRAEKCSLSYSLFISFSSFFPHFYPSSFLLHLSESQKKFVIVTVSCCFLSLHLFCFRQRIFMD